MLGFPCGFPRLDSLWIPQAGFPVDFLGRYFYDTIAKTGVAIFYSLAPISTQPATIKPIIVLLCEIVINSINISSLLVRPDTKKNVFFNFIAFQIPRNKKQNREINNICAFVNLSNNEFTIFNSMFYCHLNIVKR